MAHYKNGRPANEGDPVVLKENYPPYRTRSGVLHSINPGCTSCNAMVSYILPGQVQQTSVTIGDLYHAEDAFKAAEEFNRPPAPAPTTPYPEPTPVPAQPPVSNECVAPGCQQFGEQNSQGSKSQAG